MQETPTTDPQLDSIETLASAINKAGMAGPVSIALHMARPLTWIGGQLLWALEPFLGGIARSRSSLSLRSIATLLEREEDVVHLIARLDLQAPSHREQHGP
jgi:hypothetical protein